MSKPLVAGAAGYGVTTIPDLRRAEGGSGAIASLRLSRTRLLFLGAVATYIAAFWWSYVVDVVPLGEYFGFAYDPE